MVKLYSYHLLSFKIIILSENGNIGLGCCAEADDDDAGDKGYCWWQWVAVSWFFAQVFCFIPINLFKHKKHFI